MNNKYNYKAFISYSHKDERWATWLHRAIESYRVPRKLVGTTTSAGKVPRRIRPVFRDRDDLSSSADLSKVVKQSLVQAENLIVLCSPDSAASVWVNQEIREFVRLGRQQRIFCVIVGGDSEATESGPVCFPPALAEAGSEEPLAADARKWADGKHLARLKVIAGMLGLPLDQLRRRDLQKRQKTWAFSLLASIAVIAVLVAAIMFQIAAQQRRNSGESLVGYKLTELRTMLNVTQDPEDLSRLEKWDKQALNDLIEAAGEGEGALTASAMSLRKEGQDYWRAGEYEQAISSFEDSWALLAEQFRHDRNDTAVFFEMGQAEFWIAQANQDNGDLDAAEDAFMAYAEITRRLILEQPANAEWVLEMTYALTNLGRLQSLRGTSQPERMLQLMQSALEYNQIALVLDPGNGAYRSELGQSHLNLADAQQNVCDLDGALQTMSASVSLESDLLQSDQGNIKKMQFLAYALSGYADVRIQQGQNVDAQEYLERSLSLLQAAAEQEEESRRNKRPMLVRKFHIARALALQGETKRALIMLNATEKQWQELDQSRAATDIYGSLDYVNYLLLRAWLFQSEGNADLAAQLLLGVFEKLSVVLTKFPDHRDAGNFMTLAVFQYWQLKQELPAAGILAFLPDYRSEAGRTRACTDAGMAVRKAVMFDEIQYAVGVTDYLLTRGYHETRFLDLCQAHSLCDGGPG